MKFSSKRLRSYFNSNPIISGSMEDLNSAIQSYKTFQAKFDESLDVCFKLNIPKSKKSLVNIRSFVTLPLDLFNKSIEKKIIILTSVENFEVVKKIGVFAFGSLDLVDKILKDEISYDLIVCTSDFISSISKLAKKLGPKGLMPSIKSETVCDLSELVSLISKFSLPRVQIRMYDDLTIKCSFAKLSSNKDSLLANLSFLIDKISSMKPKDIKLFGSFISSINVSSTMGLKFSIS